MEYSCSTRKGSRKASGDFSLPRPVLVFIAETGLCPGRGTKQNKAAARTNPGTNSMKVYFFISKRYGSDKFTILKDECQFTRNIRK
jgi:hypothetical protein